ncbi:hypothetical protein [Brevundimonas sp.]|uniref:hypothetical protein n=1 Tax=Brevundimonas sp. TaxID=1871086 RepID=UPI003D6D576C
MPASVALGDFAFVQGWKLSKGQVLRLLGLSLAIIAVVLAIELALLAVAAVVLFLVAGLNVFSLASHAGERRAADGELGRVDPLGAGGLRAVVMAAGLSDHGDDGALCRGLPVAAGASAARRSAPGWARLIGNRGRLHDFSRHRLRL